MNSSSEMIPIKKGEDPRSYRYMMHRITTKSKGKSTVIPDIDVICHEIGRSPLCIKTWYTISMGVTTQLDSKNQNELQINGKHDAKALQDSLYEFIAAFVACPTCSNPETTMFVKKNSGKGDGPLLLQCRACGSSGPASVKTKAQQKMATWIVKHINEDLQSHQLKDDKKIETLDDFEVPGPDQF